MSENELLNESGADGEATDQAGASARPPAPSRRWLSGATAGLALLLAVLALAAVGVDYLRARGDAAAIADSGARLASMNDTVAAARDAITALDERIDALSRQDASRLEAIERLQRDLATQQSLFEAVPDRLAAMESSLAALRGISTGARQAWLVAEAEYYMQIANAQLQLAGNPRLAGIALSYADERIRQLADPRLTVVREALADERRALDALQQADIAGITLTLASLSGVVESLPLREEVERPSVQDNPDDDELSGMDRAWSSVKKAISGAVSVRRSDEQVRPLIAPEAQYFLRANLALQLQAARLAILRGEQAIARQSLEDADAWLVEYYDAGSASVQGARATIAEIGASLVDAATPDISRSLRLLRQFDALPAVTETEPAGPEQ